MASSNETLSRRSAHVDGGQSDTSRALGGRRIFFHELERLCGADFDRHGNEPPPPPNPVGLGALSIDDVANAAEQRDSSKGLQKRVLS
jgi:hypothetical protein